LRARANEQLRVVFPVVPRVSLVHL
jgi:hypothetical protein